MSESTEQAESMFEKALEIAEDYLDKAMKADAELSDYVAVTMIEAAVNESIELADPQDIADMLRDLADQIENDENGEEGGEEDPEGVDPDDTGCQR